MQHYESDLFCFCFSGITLNNKWNCVNLIYLYPPFLARANIIDADQKAPTIRVFSFSIATKMTINYLSSAISRGDTKGSLLRLPVCPSACLSVRHTFNVTLNHSRFFMLQ